MKNTDAKRMIKLTKKGTIPILTKTALVRNGYATCDNLEIRLSVKTDIKGEGVIDLETFSKVKAYDSAEIRDGFLFVKRGNAVSKFATLPVDDFPSEVPCERYLGDLNISDSEAIRSLTPFVGNDELRPAMSGVYIGEKHFVATDAHKLRWLPNPSKVFDIIIPAEASAQLVPELYLVNENADKTRISFMGESQIITFRPIQGRYPDYWGVIPKENSVRLEVNTKKLVAAIQNALPSANKSTNKIQLVAEAAKLTVSAEDSDFNREYSEEIPASLTGAQMFPIAFNGKFMQVVLDKSIETTVIEMSQPNRAMIVNSNTLLMPVKLEDELQPVFGVKIGKGNNPTFEKMLENLLQLYRKSERDMSFHISQTMAGEGYKLGRQQLVEYMTGETLPKAKCGIGKIEALCKIRFDEMIAAETVEETPIQPETKTGKFSPEPVEPEEAEVIDETPEAEPEPEPENEPEAIEAEVIDETPEPEPETETEAEDLPDLITVIENLTEKAFAVVGFTELLPEEFLNKYGSKCKVKVGDQRVEGYMFSKKRREALNEAIVAVGITYQTA